MKNHGEYYGNNENVESTKLYTVKPQKVCYCQLFVLNGKSLNQVMPESSKSSIKYVRKNAILRNSKPISQLEPNFFMSFSPEN